jgi:hypothetical protein
MAMKADMGVHCDQMNICKPNTTAEEKKINTMIRIINAAFLPEFRTKLLQSNDAFKCKDFEGSSTRNPNDELWQDISEVVNDPQQNNRIGVVCDSKPGEDEHLVKWMDEKSLNPNDFTPGSAKTCAAHIKNLMKARSKILCDKKISGTHQPDTF